jgi:MFS family permease
VEEAHPSFRWLAIGTLAWFAAWGMGSVAVTWIAVGELHVSGSQLALTQMALQLPPLTLLLAGGAIADRVDPRRQLALAQLGLLIPIAAFAQWVVQGAHSLGPVVAYALCIGVASAFGSPPRDLMLSRVAGPDLMRAVTALTICQFGGQVVGSFGGGGAARAMGIPTLLGVQALLVALGALAATRLPRPGPRAGPRGHWLAGLGAVVRRPVLRVPVGLVTAIGVFFMGPFMVAFPKIIHDVYGGDAQDLGVVLGTFPIGTILGSLGIRARGGIERKGLAMLFALANGTLMLALLSFGMPYAGFLIVALLWGTGGAVFINSSRTLVQEAAPEALRGRVLAVYQLGFVGSGVLGAALSGVLCDALGPLGALRVCAVCMAIVVGATTLFSSARALGAPVSAEGAGAGGG